MRTVSVELPVELADFLEERVGQINRHFAILEGEPKSPLTVEGALCELVAAWRDQVDPEHSPLLDYCP